MASQSAQRRVLPIQRRLFEVSRLNDDLMASAYALIVPTRDAPLANHSPSPRSEREAGHPEGTPWAEGGLTA